MADGSSGLSLDTETPIMAQFGVSTTRYEAAVQRYNDAQCELDVARAGWKKAERDFDHARSEMEQAVRACHAELLQKIKALTA